MKRRPRVGVHSPIWFWRMTWLHTQNELNRLRRRYDTLVIRERERHQELIQCRLRLQPYLTQEQIQRPADHDEPPDALAALAEWEARCWPGFPAVPVTPEEDEAWTSHT